jgi:hypothetical protein
LVDAASTNSFFKTATYVAVFSFEALALLLLELHGRIGPLKSSPADAVDRSERQWAEADQGPTGADSQQTHKARTDQV